MLERYNDRTPGVLGATGLYSLVNLVYTQSTKAVRNVLQEAVQIRTAGQHKFRSVQFVLHGLINNFERSNGRTPSVPRVTGPPTLVQLLYTESTGTVRDRFEGIIQIRTAGVRKCRSLHIVYHGLVNIREQSKGRTPGVQVAMGPLSLVQFVYTQPDSAVRSPTFGSCTDQHSKCTNYRSLQIVRHGTMNCREPPGNRTHAWCTSSNGISQFSSLCTHSLMQL